MRLIFLLFLITISSTGCSMLSPFKAVTSCSDTANAGANCASLESNLEYSIAKDNITTDDLKVDSASAAEKDELIRLMAELSISTNVTKNPTLIMSRSYKVLVFPYSSGDKFYSARYMYITAGKPKWVAGNYILSEKEPVRVETPIAKAPQFNAETFIKETVGMPDELKVPEKPKTYKHRVNAYLLNCRDMPSIEGNSVAVFDQDKVLDVVDKSQDWWQVNYYDMQCYVNPKYLYGEGI